MKGVTKPNSEIGWSGWSLSLTISCLAAGSLFFHNFQHQLNTPTCIIHTSCCQHCKISSLLMMASMRETHQVTKTPFCALTMTWILIQSGRSRICCCLRSTSSLVSSILIPLVCFNPLILTYSVFAIRGTWQLTARVAGFWIQPNCNLMIRSFHRYALESMADGTGHSSYGFRTLDGWLILSSRGSHGDELHHSLSSQHKQPIIQDRIC